MEDANMKFNQKIKIYTYYERCFFSSYSEKFSNYKVIHFSHNSCGTSQNRINFIEKLLNNQDKC